MEKKLFKVCLFAMFCIIDLSISSCANEDITQKTTKDTDNDNDKNLTSFITGTESRTSMDNSGAFYWEAGDYIYVIDDYGTWQKSTNTPTEKTAFFRFKVPGKFTNSGSYKVFYPGKNGYQNTVMISKDQTQTEPNTTTHFGESGDCGTATATGIIGGENFSFKLDHQVAYLIFQPFTSNNILKKCYLTKVEVNSDDDITDNYPSFTLSTTTGELSGTGYGKQIILTTKGSGAYANGFPLTNTSPSVSTNGAYMVIKPGTHTLKIRYWLKDIASGTEGTITKVIGSHTFVKNKYYNMTASLDARDYEGLYYMWDGQVNYWNGHEWNSADPWQPTVNGGHNENYPKNPWGGTIGLPYSNDVSIPSETRYDALYSCKSCPNVNEMSWFVKRGEPHWDSDELWTTMGHLYKGGMWFKTRNTIVQENSSILTGVEDMKNKNCYGYDARASLNSYDEYPAQSQPDAAELSKYFFLPALGGYFYAGTLSEVGEAGLYWSSSGRSWSNVSSYSLFFQKDAVHTGDDGGSGSFTSRGFGGKVWTF